jgi:hypothetical protein
MGCNMYSVGRVVWLVLGAHFIVGGSEGRCRSCTGHTGRMAEATLGRAQGRVGTGEVPYHKTKIETVLPERLLDREAILIELELIAEAVQPGLD